MISTIHQQRINDSWRFVIDILRQYIERYDSYNFKDGTTFTIHPNLWCQGCYYPVVEFCRPSNTTGERANIYTAVYRVVLNSDMTSGQVSLCNPILPMDFLTEKDPEYHKYWPYTTIEHVVSED